MARTGFDFALSPPRRTGDDSRDLFQLYEWLSEFHADTLGELTRLRAQVTPKASAALTADYWRNMAARLDPRALNLATASTIGNDWRLTVPAHEKWWQMCAFFLDGRGESRTGVNEAAYAQRIIDFENAHPLAPGDALAPFFGDGNPGNTNTYVLYSRPQSVYGIDQRYAEDPEGLYRARMSLLESLPTRKTIAHIPAGSASNTRLSVDMDWGSSDADYGFIWGVFVQDAAWYEIVGRAQDETTGIFIALHEEISDNHEIRLGTRCRCPLIRKRPGIWGLERTIFAAGNIPGDFVTATEREGYGVLEWKIIPKELTGADWLF